MDIDNTFFNMPIPDKANEEIQPESTTNDNDNFESSEDLQTKKVAETIEEAMAAVKSCPLINNEMSTTNDNDSSNCEEAVTETEKVKTVSALNSEEITAMFDEIKKMSSQLSEIIENVAGIKSGISRFNSYDSAVDTLKRSLSVHQRNEDNIYKELEQYKKNQYYNYIRPFFEFLISLLTDMISSKKDYQNDEIEFVEKHGQGIFDEIIDLHNYYIDQIVSQLQIQGVEVIEYQPNTPFIPTEQLISTPVLTEDISMVGQVASADSYCYKFEEKIVKKAKVHVYKAKPAEKI